MDCSCQEGKCRDSMMNMFLPPRQKVTMHTKFLVIVLVGSLIVIYFVGKVPISVIRSKQSKISKRFNIERRLQDDRLYQAAITSLHLINCHTE